MPRPLRIAQVAPPFEPVPPPAYGGTERIIGELVGSLVARGHDVTTFASGDSGVPGRLVPTVRRALWTAGFTGDAAPWFMATLDLVAERAADFDLIHSHVEWYSPLLARSVSVPVVTTWHGRLDLPWARTLLHRSSGRQVAISRAQAATHPGVPWAGIVHNGLSLAAAPFAERPGDDLCFVGRISPEKGVVDAIEIALRAGRRLRIAAKSGKTAAERDYLDAVFRPALERAGSSVEWHGELSVPDRDRLFAESWATLMPGEWPEPFGLVTIESLACGTPVVGRPAGAMPEIVRDGVDGFLRTDVPALAEAIGEVGTLDRAEIRRSVIERFSADRMADGYERIYRATFEPPARLRGVMERPAAGLGADAGDDDAPGPAARPPIEVRG